VCESLMNQISDCEERPVSCLGPLPGEDAMRRRRQSGNLENKNSYERLRLLVSRTIRNNFLLLTSHLAYANSVI
jgi:hypothetical protein